MKLFNFLVIAAAVNEPEVNARGSSLIRRTRFSSKCKEMWFISIYINIARIEELRCDDLLSEATTQQRLAATFDSWRLHESEIQVQGKRFVSISPLRGSRKTSGTRVATSGK